MEAETVGSHHATRRREIRHERPDLRILGLFPFPEPKKKKSLFCLKPM